LSQCLLATGFSYDPRERAEQGAVIARLVGRINDVRQPGCAALDLCHVAAGWVDAYVQHGLNLWDWAAGALIAEEAGAVVHWPGTPGPAATIGDPVFASAPGIAADLIDALAAAGASSLRAANSAMVRALPSVLPPQTA
jgi:myo-inositol-1(or 4)-monophosphatase